MLRWTNSSVTALVIALAAVSACTQSSDNSPEPAGSTCAAGPVEPDEAASCRLPESLHIFSRELSEQTLRGTDNDDVFFIDSRATPAVDDPVWTQVRTAHGGGGNDTYHGRPGQDIFFGGANTDICKLGLGGLHDEHKTGDPEHGDRAGLGSGVDLCVGGGGSDEIDGGPDGDLIYGHLGDDLLIGGEGDDVLRGGGGNDLIVGVVGRDVNIGNEGADTFQVGLGDVPTGLVEVILDYRMDDGDVLRFSTSDWSSEQTSAGVLFTFPDDGKVLLVGVASSDVVIESTASR